MDPTRDGLGPPAPTHEHRRHFSQIVEHRLLPVGHQLAQQAPEAFTAAVAALRF